MTISDRIHAPHEVASPPLQMVQATVDRRQFHRWAGSRRLMSGNLFDEGYAMHCFLAGVFGNAAPKPFRLITPTRPGAPSAVLYGYSRADSEILREAAALYADPFQTSALPPENLNSKPMPIRWQPGRRLGFQVLVRPVVRSSDRSQSKGSERDVFQTEAEEHPQDGMERTRLEVYHDWLATKFAKGGATLEGKSVLKSFERVRSIRKLHQRPIEGPSALMAGNLIIDDPEAFAHLVSHGVGRHLSYGYGMLLLRPPMRGAGRY